MTSGYRVVVPRISGAPSTLARQHPARTGECPTPRCRWGHSFDGPEMGLWSTCILHMSRHMSRHMSYILYYGSQMQALKRWDMWPPDLGRTTFRHLSTPSTQTRNLGFGNILELSCLILRRHVSRLSKTPLGQT